MFLWNVLPSPIQCRLMCVAVFVEHSVCRCIWHLSQLSHICLWHRHDGCRLRCANANHRWIDTRSRSTKYEFYSNKDTTQMMIFLLSLLLLQFFFFSFFPFFSLLSSSTFFFYCRCCCSYYIKYVFMLFTHSCRGTHIFGYSNMCSMGTQCWMLNGCVVWYGI